MKPMEVNDNGFSVDCVLYDDGDFSVAWGTWDKNNRCLGMRWNGDENSKYPAGFPIGKGGRPVWLVIPADLSVPFISALLAKASADQSALLKVLRELLAGPTV